MIIWGGTNLGSDLNTGGRYCAQGAHRQHQHLHLRQLQLQLHHLHHADADAYANAHTDANAHAMHRKMSTDPEAGGQLQGYGLLRLLT